MEKKPHNTSEEILEKSTKGATFLMMGQFFGKLVTFMLNSVLLRFLSPRIFGITAFLEFLLSTVLFFSREAIRLSTLRIKDSDSEDTYYYATSPLEKDKVNVLQTAVNFAHVPLWIGIPLSIVLTTWQYNNVNAYFVDLPYFTHSILLIWVSILVELASEPFFIVNQFMLNYGTRSKFESIALTFGSIVNLALMYAFESKKYGFGGEDETAKEGFAILAFAMGKLTHSSVLLACYYYDYLKNFANKRLFNLQLTKMYSPTSKSGYYFQHNILEHFKKVYFQMCFKHLLTEGDKLVINSLCTVEEQGIYSLLSNYGSLVTRLLFAPIEETLRLFLGRLLSTHNSKNLKLSMEVLVNLTKFYLYFSLVVVVFGPVNSSFLLQFLIGSKWSTTSLLDTIRVYCFYLPFLALNGIFEAFFQSVASGDHILRHSYLMMVFSGVFLFNCWVLIKYLDMSINGLILSNIINMTLRIAYCGHFINQFYKDLFTESSFMLNFKNMKPTIAAGALIAITNWATIGYVRNFKQLFANISFALGLLGLVLFKERKAIKQLVTEKKLSFSKDV